MSWNKDNSLKKVGLLLASLQRSCTADFQNKDKVISPMGLCYYVTLSQALTMLGLINH